MVSADVSKHRTGFTTWCETNWRSVIRPRIGCGSFFRNSKRLVAARWPSILVLNRWTKRSNIGSIQFFVAVSLNAPRCSPDNLKFRSCMTLFRQVAPHEPVFGQALERFFHGKPDIATVALLQIHR